MGHALVFIIARDSLAAQGVLSVTKRLSSSHPTTQEVLSCIAVHDNQGLRTVLGHWVKEKGEAARNFDMFFLAACEKRGAGVIRILLEEGFSCSDKPLYLACERRCWAVAKAMLPACPPLYAPYVSGLSNPDSGHPLLSAIAHGELDLASRLLAHHKDPVEAAAVVLHCLAYIGSPELDFVRLVPWLVQSGADPTHARIGRFTPLVLALKNGRPRLAQALVEQGASLSSLENAADLVMAAVYRSRIIDQANIKNPQISQDGWELLELASSQGVAVPQVERTPWPHVVGYDRHTGKLYGADPDIMEALSQRFKLEQDTPTATPRVNSPRL